MALVTRCPKCTTLFKVVPDQLRISEGWVRCGHCNEVFDASVDLHQQPAEALVAVVPPSSSGMSPAESAMPEPPQLSQRGAEFPRGFDDITAQSECVDGDDGAVEVVPEGISAEAVLEAEFDRELHAIEAEAQLAMETQDPLAPTHVEVAVPEEMPGDVLAGAAHGVEQGWRGMVDSTEAGYSDSVEPSVPDMPTMAEDAVFVAPMVSTAVDAAASDNELMATSASTQAVVAPLTETSTPIPSVDDYSFLRNAATKNSIWRRPGVRYGLIGLTGVLLLMLVAQWLLVQREVVAAHWPQSRPWLVSLCEPLGCTVSPLRRIDAIAIDSSAFTATRRGAYRLTVVLKNQGMYPLAVPAVELALTDSQEQAVIRRVIQPRELGITAGVIDARSELAAVVDLAVPESDTAARIVGYRLLAFYP